MMDNWQCYSDDYIDHNVDHNDDNDHGVDHNDDNDHDVAPVKIGATFPAAPV